MYEKDLSSGVTTLLVDLGTSNTTGYGLDLNSIYYTGHVWRRGQATVDLTLGTLYRLSHDGRYAIDVVGANVVLHDLDTGTNTVVCSATSGTPDLPIIDWTGGPPPAGTWCVGADKQRYVDSTGAVWHPTYGQHGIVTSGHDGWYSGIGVYTPRGGVVPLSAPIRHDLLAGNFPASWVYLFDPTP